MTVSQARPASISRWNPAVVWTALEEWAAFREAASPVEELLRGLCIPLGAAGFGLAGPFPFPFQAVLAGWQDGRVCEAWPWQNDPQLADRVRGCPQAETLVDGAGRHWLVASVGTPDTAWALAWLAGEQAFPAEARSWVAAAGQFLLHALAQISHPWLAGLARTRQSETLEQAAVVAGKLAHDFGNHLTGMIGFTELALAQVKAGTTIHAYLQEAWQGANRSADWVRKLQTFSRRSVRAPKPTDLAQVVAVESRQLASAWSDQTPLRVEMPADLPPIAVDTTSVQMILTQLLDNARGAVAGGGVHLSARVVDVNAQEGLQLLGQPRPGHYVEISVSDSGPGLPAQVRAGNLVQLMTAPTKQGRGMGLAVAYGCVKACGGGLAFGPHPERGSTVRVLLPIAQAKPAV